MSRISTVNDPQVGTVYETTNYGQFTNISTNRDISQVSVSDITKSMNRSGWIGAPIVVNENMEIIDGQNRHVSAAKTHTPLRYTICPGYGIDECIILNVNGTKWNTSDYTKSYAKRGVPEYVWLTKLHAKYKNMNLDNLTAIAYNKGKSATNSSSIRRIVREGKLSLTKAEMDEVEAIVDMLSTKYASYCKSIGGKQFVLYNTILFAYHQPDIDGDKLAKIFEEHWHEIAPAFSTEEYLGQIDKFYNANIPAKSGKRVSCRGAYICMKAKVGC